MLHAEEEWHPVSFDNHDGFKGDEDYSCGDAVTMFGGMKCCYPPDRCGGGKAGSFHNISVSVVTDKLQILIDRKDGGQRCNGGIMYLDEILIWGNKPKCMDRCEKDCSGTGKFFSDMQHAIINKSRSTASSLSLSLCLSLSLSLSLCLSLPLSLSRSLSRSLALALALSRYLSLPLSRYLFLSHACSVIWFCFFFYKKNRSVQRTEKLTGGTVMAYIDC